MAFLRFRITLALAAVLALTSLAVVACGDDDDDGGDTTATPTSPAARTPATEQPSSTPTVAPATPTRPPGTVTPTPQPNSMPGFIAALEELSKELSSGKMGGVVSRMKVVDYTCTAADVAGGLGTASDCTTVGQTYRGFQTSQWRSEGGIRPAEKVVENLQGYAANFDTAKSDEYGAGTFRIYAYDPTKTTAVLTVVSKCLPQYQCDASGVQRLVWVPTLEYIDGRWKIASLMCAFVLGEEFLDPPSAEVKQRMPQWTKLD